MAEKLISSRVPIEEIDNTLDRYLETGDTNILSGMRGRTVRQLEVVAEQVQIPQGPVEQVVPGPIVEAHREPSSFIDEAPSTAEFYALSPRSDVGVLVKPEKTQHGDRFESPIAVTYQVEDPANRGKNLTIVDFVNKNTLVLRPLPQKRGQDEPGDALIRSLVTVGARRVFREGPDAVVTSVRSNPHRYYSEIVLDSQLPHHQNAVRAIRADGLSSLSEGVRRPDGVAGREPVLVAAFRARVA